MNHRATTPAYFAPKRQTATETTFEHHKGTPRYDQNGHRATTPSPLCALRTAAQQDIALRSKIATVPQCQPLCDQNSPRTTFFILGMRPICSMALSLHSQKSESELYHLDENKWKCEQIFFSNGFVSGLSNFQIPGETRNSPLPELRFAA